MKKLFILPMMILLNLFTSQLVLAGDFRIGAGFTEAFGNTDYSSPGMEMGYDHDHIFGVTARYNFDDEDSDAQQIVGQFEFGYTFGEAVNIKPYGAIGAVHYFGGDNRGNTGLIIGAGARATFKFIYINAEINYLPKTTMSNEDTDWAWDAYPSATVSLGFSF